MTDTARMTLTTVALNDIHPDPDNIRDAAQDADISALAADIADRGLLQPLIIYPHPDSGGYKISGGHRRYHALRRIGHTHTDANIIDPPTSDVERIDLMYAENEHRRNLNPIEIAKVYQRYADAGLNQTEISLRVKRAQSQIAVYLKLLTLSADIQRRLADGQITVNHASKLIRQDRINRGVARPDTGGTHERSITVPYFTTSHPLHPNAAARCRYLQHDPALKLGGSCGECWEYVIRRDNNRGPAEATPTAAPAARAAVEMFSDPRDLLRHVHCTRCGISALDRPRETRCATKRDGRLQLFELHEFPMQVTARLEATA